MIVEKRADGRDSKPGKLHNALQARRVEVKPLVEVAPRAELRQRRSTEERAEEQDLIQDNDRAPADRAHGFQCAERIAQLMQHIADKNQIEFSNVCRIKIVNSHLPKFGPRV